MICSDGMIFLQQLYETGRAHLYFMAQLSRNILRLSPEHRATTAQCRTILPEIKKFKLTMKV